MSISNPSRREDSVSALTGGFFTDRARRVFGAGFAQWLDAVLDVVNWKAVSRRDAAGRALVGLAGHGDERACAELLRLLVEGPPHVRLALVRALPDEIEYPILVAAWRGAQQNLCRGSARGELLLRRGAVGVACASCVALIVIQNATYVDLESEKARADLIAMIVALAATCGVMPHLTAWVRFPARSSWRGDYYRRLSELISLEANRERPGCIALLPEVLAMSELVNGDVNPLGREFRDTAALMKAAAERQGSLPIPAEARHVDTTVLPIPSIDSPPIVL